MLENGWQLPVVHVKGLRNDQHPAPDRSEVIMSNYLSATVVCSWAGGRCVISR